MKKNPIVYKTWEAAQKKANAEIILIAATLQKHPVRGYGMPIEDYEVSFQENATVIAKLEKAPKSESLVKAYIMPSDAS